MVRKIGKSLLFLVLIGILAASIFVSLYVLGMIFAGLWDTFNF